MVPEARQAARSPTEISYADQGLLAQRVREPASSSTRQRHFTEAKDMISEQMAWSRPAPLAALLGLFLLIFAQPEAAGFARAQWERAGWITEFDAGLERAHATGQPAFV